MHLFKKFSRVCGISSFLVRKVEDYGILRGMTEATWEKVKLKVSFEVCHIYIYEWFPS